MMPFSHNLRRLLGSIIFAIVLAGTGHAQMQTAPVLPDRHATVLATALGKILPYTGGKTVLLKFRLKETNGVGVNFDTFDFYFVDPIMRRPLGKRCIGCKLPYAPVRVPDNSELVVTLAIYLDPDVPHLMAQATPQWWLDKNGNLPNQTMPAILTFHGTDDADNRVWSIGLPNFAFTTASINSQVVPISFGTGEESQTDRAPAGWTNTGTPEPIRPPALMVPCPATGCVAFIHLNNNTRFNVPTGGASEGQQFGRPPLPNANELAACVAENSGDRNGFMHCVTARAFPREYRIAEDCAARNQNDAGRAFACSTNNSNILAAYDKTKAVQACSKNRSGDAELAQCLGEQFLGENERYYLGCVTNNSGSYSAIAVCALSRNLTPEQQIALNCAIATGGQPYAFAACTGGQLLSRELNKCWQNGVGTESGCFGPNNEYVRAINSIDGEARTVFGDHSGPYETFHLWKDNVLAPGPNHDIVRNVNNALHDLRGGPGGNNDVVKLARGLSNIVPSVSIHF